MNHFLIFVAGHLGQGEDIGDILGSFWGLVRTATVN